MLTGRRANTSRERGMSMIEMLVAMVLLVIVGGMVTRGLLDGLVRAQQADSTQAATIDATALAAQLGDDIRGMSMSETSVAIRNYDLPQLREIVLFDKGTPLNDLRVAEPDQLEFVADVVGPQAYNKVGAAGTGSGPECVTYKILTAAGPSKGEMHRIVRPFTGAGCSATVLSDTRVLPARPNIAGATPAVFGYRERYNAQPGKDPLNPADCASPATIKSSIPNANVQERGFVVAIDIDLRAYASNRVIVGEHQLRSTVAIRARLSHDYQYALGCSY